MPNVQDIFAGSSTYGYTIRWVSASADGSGNGTSQGSPWTLAQAFTNATFKQLVRVQAGTYNVTSNLAASNSGNSSGYIVFAGYGGRPVISLNNAAAFIGFGAAAGAGSTFIWYENMEFVKGGAAAPTNAVALGANCIAYNLKVSGCVDGIQAGANNSKVIFCESFSNTTTGMTTTAGSFILFFGNYCYNNGTNGITNSRQLCTFAYNVCVKNGNDGINNSGSNCQSFFNTTDDNTGHGMNIVNGSHFSFFNLMTNQNDVSKLGMNSGAVESTIDIGSNYFGNTSEATTNIVRVSNTAINPAYTDATNRDVSITSNVLNRVIGTPFVANPYVYPGAVPRQVTDCPECPECPDCPECQDCVPTDDVLETAYGADIITTRTDGSYGKRGASSTIEYTESGATVISDREEGSYGAG